MNLAGFTVTACNDGPTALGHIDRGYRPDMVITGERLRFTPIVALSANKQAATREQALELGASGLRVKPVGTDELVKVIRQLVAGA